MNKDIMLACKSHEKINQLRHDRLERDGKCFLLLCQLLRGCCVLQIHVSPRRESDPISQDLLGSRQVSTPLLKED